MERAQCPSGTRPRFSSLTPFLIALLLLGCEGPAGPPGPVGPPGEVAGYGLVLIEFHVTRHLYDDGVLELRDRRIAPDTYQGIYVLMERDGVILHLPLDYLLTYGVDLQEIFAHLIAVVQGAVLLADLDYELMEYARSYRDDGQAILAVLVTAEEGE